MLKVFAPQECTNSHFKKICPYRAIGCTVEVMEPLKEDNRQRSSGVPAISDDRGPSKRSRINHPSNGKLIEFMLDRNNPDERSPERHSTPERKNNRIKNTASFSVRCSQYELEQIHEAANHERRSISAYVMNALRSRLKTREHIRQASTARGN